MHWPQITYICLTMMGLGNIAAKHGQPRSPYDIGSALFATAIVGGLLYAGGFFG